jgi:hypothetical protein
MAKTPLSVENADTLFAPIGAGADATQALADAAAAQAAADAAQATANAALPAADVVAPDSSATVGEAADAKGTYDALGLKANTTDSDTKYKPKIIASDVTAWEDAFARIVALTTFILSSTEWKINRDEDQLFMGYPANFTGDWYVCTVQGDDEFHFMVNATDSDGNKAVGIIDNNGGDTDWTTWTFGGWRAVSKDPVMPANTIVQYTPAGNNTIVPVVIPVDLSNPDSIDFIQMQSTNSLAFRGKLALDLNNLPTPDTLGTKIMRKKVIVKYNRNNNNWAWTRWNNDNGDLTRVNSNTPKYSSERWARASWRNCICFNMGGTTNKSDWDTYWTGGGRHAVEYSDATFINMVRSNPFAGAESTGTFSSYSFFTFMGIFAEFLTIRENTPNPIGGNYSIDHYTNSQEIAGIYLSQYAGIHSCANMMNYPTGFNQQNMGQAPMGIIIDITYSANLFDVNITPINGTSGNKNNIT